MSDYFRYHPLVAEGAAILRQIGADSAADYFEELDRGNEDLHIRLRHMAEDLHQIENRNYARLEKRKWWQK